MFSPLFNSANDDGSTSYSTVGWVGASRKPSRRDVSSYQPHGPVSGWTWGNGQTHLRAYGLDGELQRLDSAVTRSYDYDSAGRLNQMHLWSQDDPPQNDSLQQYGLDALGRLTAIDSTLTPAAGAPLTERLAYGYDPNGNRLSLDWNDRQTTYSYNANRLVQRSGADSRSYAYDAAGRMTADGLNDYEYDALGRLAAIKRGGTTLVTYRYNALGQRIAKDLGGASSSGGSLTLFSDSFPGPENRPIDDQEDRLWKGGGKKHSVAKVQNGRALIAEGKQIQTQSQFAEGEGLRLSATLYRGRVGLTSDGGSLMVKYDGLRTITVNSDDSEDTEDPAKVRFKAAQEGLPLDVDLRLSQGKGRAKIRVGHETFDSGELAVARNPSWRIRLAAVKVKKQALTGIMDDVSLGQDTPNAPSGRRFLYDEAGHLVGEYDVQGRMIQELVWLEDWPVASLRPNASGGTTISFIHPDHLGTPRQITDESGRILWRWDTLDAFGPEPPNEDPDGDGARFEFNLRFPGQYYDQETGRHYNYFRYYDPEVGRYIESDLIGLDGGLNTYLYANANPNSFIDPTGNAAIAGGAIIIGVGGTIIVGTCIAIIVFPLIMRT